MGRDAMLVLEPAVRNPISLTFWSGVEMKRQAKLLVLMLVLILPYMDFILFCVFTYPQHAFPNRFLYVGPCYFFGSIALAVVLRKRFVSVSPLQSLERETHSAAGIDVDGRRLKGLWIGTAVYSLIFLNGLRLALAYLSKLPIVVKILGETLNGTILATCVLSIRRV
jgi:hypothetical protein